MGKLNVDVVGITTPAYFKSLMVALISAVPPRMQYFFRFTILLGGSSSSNFHWSFPTIIAHIQLGREPMWGFLQLLSVSVPITHSRTEGKTTGWVQAPTGPTVRWNWAKTPSIIWLPYAPTMTGRPLWCFESPEISVSSESVSSNPWKAISVSSTYSHPDKGCRFLWEGLWG